MSGAPPRGAPPPAATAPQVWNHLQASGAGAGAGYQLPDEFRMSQRRAPSPLQVPNYFPRQPQAAHMSSERPTSRSPLTWHTPTPPSHDHQQPPLPYRHTPTPPQPSLYRNTPPPDGLKTPLLHLQQMMDSSARTAQRPPDPLRDAYSRLSPGTASGSMDLSVSRSPRNGSQNGEPGVPISLSVRDALKINSLDATEIGRLRQATSGAYASKHPEIVKSASPTFNPAAQNSDGPESPRPSSKRPAKRVDSILERLSGGPDVSSIRHAPSPHSVIVSAHTLEDGNYRNIPNVTSVLGYPNYLPFDPAAALSFKPDSFPPAEQQRASTPAAVSSTDTRISIPPTRSVIMESPRIDGEESRSVPNRSDEDSNSSSGDSSKSKRRRKQSITNRIDNSIPLDIPDGIHGQDLSNPPRDLSKCEVSSGGGSENVTSTSETDRITDPIEERLENITNDNVVEAPVLNSIPDSDVSTSISKTRRKTSSESETIDNIAAMIASTDSNQLENPESSNVQSDKNISEADSIPPKSPTDTTQSHLLLNQTLSSPVAINEVDNSTTLPPKEISSTEDQDVSKPPIANETLESVVDSSAIQEEPKPESNSIFEVENELEKMFAGIEEVSDKPTTEDISVNQETTEISNESEKEKPAKKKRAYRKSSDTALVSSDENTPKKRKKPVKRKSTPRGKFDPELSPIRGVSKKINKAKQNNVKLHQMPCRDAYDSGSNASSSKSRGPYVQIRGPRDSPLSVNVINTPVQEEDLDKPLQKIKTLKNKTSLSIDSNFKNKVKSKGLHTSTLSMKYDATTTDTSWICVFCKRGPHTGPVRRDTVVAPNARGPNMGDLFGPYIISTECPDYLSMMNDPTDTLFKGKPCKPGTFLQSKQSMRGKKVKLDCDLKEEKTNFPNAEMYYGMTEASPNTFEVWLHEDCAVWAPGLYLVGAKIVGLDTAVWSCCTMRCEFCNNLGATVACIKRGCQKTMHVNCARADTWSMSEDNFLVYCKEHKLP